MTKAEKIFNATYHDCKEHIEAFGTGGKESGFNRLSTEEVICIRTINALLKLLGTKRKSLKLSLELGVISKDKYAIKARILDMVEATIENNKRSITL